MKNSFKLLYILLFLFFFWNNSFAETNIDSKTQNLPSEITAEDKKVLDDFVKILKDPNKVKAIINTIEKKDNNPTPPISIVEPEEKIEVLTVEHIKSLDKEATSLFILTYEKYKTLQIQEQVKNYFVDLKKDLQIVNYKYLLILLFVTSIFSLILIAIDYFYSIIYGVNNYVVDFTKYKKQTSLVKYHLFLLFINIKYFLPFIIPPFLLSEIIKINAYYINFVLIPESIINILIFFMILQLLLKFLELAFHQIKKKTLNKFKFWISALLYSLYVFLCLHYIFLILNNYALIKLNLFVFALIFLMYLLKFRFLIKKISAKILKEKIHEYKKFILHLKKYSITLLYIATYCYLISILFLDSSITKSIIVKLFIVLMGITFIYLMQSYISNLFIKKLSTKIEKRSEAIFEKAFGTLETQVISLRVFWKFFRVLYLVLFSAIYINFLDNVLSTNYLLKLVDFVSSGLFNIIANIFISFCLLMIISFILVLFIEKYLYKLALAEDLVNLRKILTLYKILQKPYKILFFAILLILIVSSLGISLTTLLASTGILTLLVAFGMKDILQNFFNSIMFLLENSFALNDFIELDGKQGTVEEISMVYVKIRDSWGNLIMIPFKNIGNIVNYTKDYSYALVDVGVAYGSNIDKVFEVLKVIGKELETDAEINSFILSPIEIIGVIALADSSVNIRCKIKTTAGKQFKVRAILYQKIHQRFMEQDIEIPFRQSVITIKKELD
jgi:small-conductance mechanosensitive channel